MTFDRRIDRRAFVLAALATMNVGRTTSAQPATPTSPTLAAGALYTVDLPVSALPSAPVAVGAAGVLMLSHTTVMYPEGAAGQSVAIDHILAGGYEIETDSELIHIDTAGNITEIDSGEKTSVATGETIVILHNELAQRISAGDEEARTLTVGFFSLQRGTNETTVDGTLEQEVIGGTILQSLPTSDVTVTILPAADTGDVTGVVARVPANLGPDEDWMILMLAQSPEATPLA